MLDGTKILTETWGNNLLVYIYDETGATSNIASDAIKGEISGVQDFIESGVKGAVSNAIGYGVGKGLAKLKVNNINSMNRAEKKNYLTKHVFKNSRSLANVNLHTYMDAPLSVVESHLPVFKYGIYSTISSTLSGRAIFG